MKKVCMFVWNHFTNDARVLRECTALAEAGYQVDLIAIEDIQNKAIQNHEKINGFDVYRVKRYPKFLFLPKKILKKLKTNPILFCLFFLFWLFLLFKVTIVTLILTLIVLMLCSKKLGALLTKGNIIIGMIRMGLKKDYDIYHSNDLNTLPQGWICGKVLRKRKLIYDSHEVQSSRTGYSGKVKYIEKFFIKRIDRMIMTTKTRADYTENLYKIIKPEVIHNYPFFTEDESIINKYDLYSIAKIPREEPILLYQGGIQSGRGLEKIVEAMKDFDRGIVIFIGDGKLKNNLINLVKEKGLEERTRFLNKVPVDELKYYTANGYLGFQVLNNVCFNHYSALSNKLFEYLMSDVPVVACDFPEIKRIVEGEKIGITVDSHNPKEISKAVNRLLKDKEFYEFSKENCKRAKNKYNWNNEKDFFTNIYDDLLEVSRR